MAARTSKQAPAFFQDSIILDNEGGSSIEDVLVWYNMDAVNY